MSDTHTETDGNRTIKKLIDKHVGSIEKRKLADLIRDGLWTIGSLIILGVAAGYWQPGSDWTTAIKWVICVGLGSNLIWSLAALSRTLIMLKEKRDY